MEVQSAGDDKTSKVNSSLISQILGVMKSEFNKTQSGESESSGNHKGPQQQQHTGDQDGPPITDSSGGGKRSLRSHFRSPDDPPPEGTVAAEVKRSARRSKGPGESVLQSAIARKEKSFCSPPSATNNSRKLRQPSLPTNKRKSTGGNKTPTPISQPLPPPKKSSSHGGSQQSSHHQHHSKSKRSRQSNSSERGDTPAVTPDLPAEDDGEMDESESGHSLELRSDLKRKTNHTAKSHNSSLEENQVLLRSRRSARSGVTSSSPSHADSSSESGNAGGRSHANEAARRNASIRRVLCSCRSRRGPRAARCSTEALPSSEGEDSATTVPGELFCQAVEHIDQTLVGCLKLASGSRLRRPAPKIPYMLLCETHARRLSLHNCCPGCGVFCSQGRFVQCEWSGRTHHFHRNCQLVVGGSGSAGNETLCPHCGAPTPDLDVKLEMKTPKTPIFLPSQRRVRHGPCAKMVFPTRGSAGITQEEEDEELLPRATFVLPTLPSGPHSEEDKERFSLKNLFNAAKSGDTELVLNIFGFGHNVNHIFSDMGSQTALHAASQEGHLATAHLLVQAGAQLDVMDEEQLTPLMHAVLAGHAPVVKYLVKAGATLKLKGSDGMTALHLAAKSGNQECCALLLTDHSLASPRSLLDAQDEGGWTALVWACEHSHFPVVKYLIRKGADPLIRDTEQNIALHWSTFSGSVDISELLLNYGCDVNATNAQGDTPLHIGARQENYECVLLLLARGARVEARNVAGDRPLDCCPRARTDCHTAINMNLQLQNLLSGTMERTIRVISNDITRGKEQNPIQVMNGVDDTGVPTDFIYITENCFTTDIHVDRKITSLQWCRCTDTCNTANCMCAHVSLRCWYNDEGCLLPEFNFSDPPLLFECNTACGCNRITCNNRLVQHGPSARFQVFRAAGKGWGVKTLRPIPKGAYVCEYIGEIISDSDADRREDDSYLFDLDNRDGETFCIDARRYGNIARFINHSCSPNLLPVKVFIDHQDLRFPRIALFASRSIEANEELGFDYGEKFWMIKCKSFTCSCAAETCRYSASTIRQTLEAYHRRLQQQQAAAATQQGSEGTPTT